MDEQSQIDQFANQLIQELEFAKDCCIRRFEDFLTEDSELNFEDYLAQLKKSLKTCSCQNAWFSDTLSIHCYDCQLGENSCVCVSCFLKGNHEGHKVRITHSSNGTCDCGDPLNWSPKGFCCDHPGPEPHPEMTQLTSQTRIKLIAVAKAAFHYYLSYATIDPQSFNELTQWFQKIVSLGDATRRCICIGLRDSLEYVDLYSHCLYLNPAYVKSLTLFLGSLCNDDVFREYLSMTVIKSLPKLIWINYRIAVSMEDEKMPPIQNSDYLFKFIFHAFSSSIVIKLMKENKLDCLGICTKSLNLIFAYAFSNLNKKLVTKMRIFSSFDKCKDLFTAAFELKGNESPEIRSFVHQLAINCISKEFTYPIIREFDEKKDDPLKIQSATFNIYYSLYDLVETISKEKIYLTEPLSLLADFFKSPRFLNIDPNYQNKSIDPHYRYIAAREVQIAQTFITHLIAFNCLNLKEKSLVDYIKDVTTDNVDDFLRNWALIPLRWVIATYLIELNLYARNDDQTYIALSSFKFKPNIEQSFVPVFSMLQKFLKTTTDVDSYLMMIISSFGLTDPLSKEQLDDRQMRHYLFSIFHFIISLIFDKLCQENDMFAIRRFAYMTHLMTKEINISELKDIWYGKILTDEQFIEDFQSFASKTQTKNGTVFRLSNGSDWHPLLPYLHTNVIIDTISKFVSNNPDSIVNFPELPKDGEHILFSPVLYALEYHILSHETCTDFKSIHQLLFPVLIQTATCFNELDQNEPIQDLTIEALNFKMLTEKLKNISFPQFLLATIKYSGQQNSMVSLLLSLGNIGKSVIKRMNLSAIQLPNEVNTVDDQKASQAKKERAKMIKDKIMSNFTNQQKQFASSVSIDTHNDTDQNECNVCHEDRPDDFLCYPAFVYNNPLASVIKNRFKNYEINTQHSNPKLDKIPAFISRPSIRMCLHPVHFNCLRIRDKLISCPADRCPRNVLIPAISTDIEKIRPGLERLAQVAYRKSSLVAISSLASDIEILEVHYRSNPSCLDNQATSLAMQSIYFMILNVLDNKYTLDKAEIRRRKRIIKNELLNSINPDFESLNEYQKSLIWAEFKMRNGFEWDENFLITESYDENIDFAFLSINDSTGDYNSINVDYTEPQLSKYLKTKEEKYLTPFMKYIALSIELDSKHNHDTTDVFSYVDMQQFIKGNPKGDDLFSIDMDIVNDLSSQYNLITFLRCAAIFDHFARNRGNFADSKLIDWDSILSVSNLLELYKIKEHSLNVELCESQSLPMFSFIDLPKMFLDLSRPPYNVPILDTDQGDLFMCLLTGKICSRDPRDEFVLKYLENNLDNSDSIFLAINGKMATDVIIICYSTGQIISLNSIYLDQLGDSDLGIKRGSLLYLNDSKTDELIDTFLSGAWTNKINVH